MTAVELETNNNFSNNTPLIARRSTDISLMKWKNLKAILRANNENGVVDISADDVFRITKMAYKNNYLLIFLTGHVGEKLYQFYVEAKCDLYSYKFCYNNHVYSTCRFGCKNYKAFVMPGLRDVYMETFNVAKYKRYENGGRGGNRAPPKPLDYFLRDINRVHMQTDLKEGQYVSFQQPQKCVNNNLKCAVRDLDSLKTMFAVVPLENLKKKIAPVVMCYDIETHSKSANQFSNASSDHIISISMVMNRGGVYTFVCLYYMRRDAADDLTANNDNKVDSDKIVTVRFEDELEMLKAFFELLPLFNADCLVDYNGDKFDLPYIIERWNVLSRKGATSPFEAKRIKLADNRADEKIKINRYDLEPVEIEIQTLHDKFNNKINNHLFTYFVHVDLYQFLSSDSEHKNLENFQLNTVSNFYLQQSKVDLKYSEIIEYYNAGRVRKIIEYNIEDSVLPIKLLLKLEILDFLYTQCALLYLCTDDLLSNISHKISVVFFYLCVSNTKITASGEIVPDPYIFNKNDLNITSGRQNTRYAKNKYNDDDCNKITVKQNCGVDLSLLKRTPIACNKIPHDAVKLCSTLTPDCNYKGGKVLSPVSGLKKWVATLDFNSLYPTIMMCEGVCFSNLFIGADNCVYLVNNVDAINPKVLKNLAKLRSEYKAKRDQQGPGSFLYHLYDTLQNAVKRIANSIYGYFGIFFIILANYITKIGRNKLMESVSKIEAMSGDHAIKQKYNLSIINFKIIYGDTDSSFIQVEFEENEIAPNNRFVVIEDIIKNFVLKKLNSTWNNVGYKMSLENVMSTLILLKKKKYCYINSENRIKYKGWLIKKDMPLFMRKTFRAVVDSYLRGHSVACGMKLLTAMMTQYYNDFYKGVDENNLSDYGFSMSYNENSTTANKKKRLSQTEATARKPVITIAKHCREILMQSGTKNLPGNGDRIPFLLIDVKGKITEKSYPLALFDLKNASTRMSWLKHMNILCNFINELIQIFGNRLEFEYYFEKICSLYTSTQLHDVKYPALSAIRKSTRNKEDGDDVENDTCLLNYTHQFKMYVKKPGKQKNYCLSVCNECLVDC
ncbi:polymerase [Gynaephora ruoergensis nucleopolyhedrovirus]|nr:polymerase [Gynaephora ruoergensis nucleopolyhedrovirus]